MLFLVSLHPDLIIYPQVAFFGCGDSASYGDYFCDAVGELYDQFSATGASCIGVKKNIRSDILRISKKFKTYKSRYIFLYRLL